MKFKRATKAIKVTPPIIGAIAVTRVLLGLGAGLLLSPRVKDARRPIGWTLLGLGAVSTAPLVRQMLRA